VLLSLRVNTLDASSYPDWLVLLPLLVLQVTSSVPSIRVLWAREEVSTPYTLHSSLYTLPPTVES